MSGKRTVRSSVLIAGLALCATLGATSPGRATPVVTYKCTGSIVYSGSAFQFYSGWLWSWTFDSFGTCVGGVAQKLTYTVHGNSMPGCGGPIYATGSPKQPTSVYLVSTEVTSKRTGNTSEFRQQWVGGQINKYSPVPSRYIPIGGITGYALIVNGNKNRGTWESPTITGKVAFAFGSEEIPNTDQPDGQAC
jgi:hypothetical protein